MRKRLNPDAHDFRIFRMAWLSLLLFFGCGGGDDMPCVSCDDPPYSSRPVSSSSVMYIDKGNDISNYRIVQIGEQTWMAENLNYAVVGGKCYDNDPANCDKYGMLYDWATAMNGAASSSKSPSGIRGVCPSGWHLPSAAEWGALMQFVNPSCSTTEHCNGAGTLLKAAIGWNTYDGEPFGTDAFGFSALPGGDGYSSGSFLNVGYNGIWWSATENDASYAWARNMYYNLAEVGRGIDDKARLFSVRCVQD